MRTGRADATDGLRRCTHRTRGTLCRTHGRRQSLRRVALPALPRPAPRVKRRWRARRIEALSWRNGRHTHLTISPPSRSTRSHPRSCSSISPQNRVSALLSQRGAVARTLAADGRSPIPTPYHQRQRPWCVSVETQWGERGGCWRQRGCCCCAHPHAPRPVPRTRLRPHARAAARAAAAGRWTAHARAWAGCSAPTPPPRRRVRRLPSPVPPLHSTLPLSPHAHTRHQQRLAVRTGVLAGPSCERCAAADRNYSMGFVRADTWMGHVGIHRLLGFALGRQPEEIPQPSGLAWSVAKAVAMRTCTLRDAGLSEVARRVIAR